MNSITERKFTKFLAEKTQEYPYRVIEYNADRTYMLITHYNKNKELVGDKEEYFEGVSLADIDTISKVIDVTKTIIIRL